MVAAALVVVGGALAVTAFDELLIATGFNPQPPAFGPTNWPLATLADFFAELEIFLFVSLLGAPIWCALHSLGFRKPAHAALAGSILALSITALIQVWTLGHQSRAVDTVGEVLASNRSITWTGWGVILRRSLLSAVYGALAGFTAFKIAYARNPPAWMR